MMLRLMFGTLIMGLAMGNLFGQSTYRLPPPEVVEIIDAKPEPSLSLSPDGEWLLLLERDAMPAISDLSRRMLKLAGLRIDPVANGLFRTDYYRGLSLRRRSSDDVVRIPLPANVRIGTVNWSHLSDAFAFTVITDRGTELWRCDVHAWERPTKLTDRLSAVLADWTWMPDGTTIVAPIIPANRGPEPEAPTAPLGPVIEESLGNKSPTRTLQDLLTSPFDELLFDYFGTSQMVMIHQDGTVVPIGEPKMFELFSPSPIGNHFLVSIIERPYSYTLSYGSFPKTIAVFDLQGNCQYTVAKVPMEENIPIEGVRGGPRRVHWRAGFPANLCWVEALDEGDPKRKVDHRDRFMSILFPFDTPPKELFRLPHRFSGVSYFRDGTRLLATEVDRDRRWTTTYLYDLSIKPPKSTVFIDRSIRDQYGDPGRVVMEPDAQGNSVVLEADGKIFMTSNGATPDGLRPFLDQYQLNTGSKERLWRCEGECLESVVAVQPPSGTRAGYFLTRHESSTSPPNYFEWGWNGKDRIQRTSFRDPTPSIRSIQKQIVKYERADGVPLSATLYLPADHKPGTRLPLLVWAYPLEFSDAATAGQLTSSPFQFVRMTGISHLTLVTQGFCIMDNATMPVVGDPDTMNDTFIEQIVASAQAAIDKAVDLGVADRNRVAVGGHSYGAFMTANLMAHCDLFRAGVARSGAYNRTLTPFGFQAERRPLWEAKDSYLILSPFLSADQIKQPLLLIHGENDNNPGTFPVQSQRMYQAIRGTGGTARLVMLPFEGHGYRARESVLHVQAEMIDWLNRYVRDVVTSGSKDQ